MNEDKDRLKAPEEVGDYLGVSVGTLYGWRYRGLGPRAVKVGKHLRYRQSEVDEWLEQQASAS